jgi:hypothetical protein
VFADEIIAKYESNLKAQHKMRANGQTTTQTKKPSPEIAMSQDDLEEALLNAIQDGDAEAVQKLSRQSYAGRNEVASRP